MPVFTVRQKIGFQHCDPAGIVFYPRYYEMLNRVIEEWFEEKLCMPWAVLHSVENGAAVPTVHCSMDFNSPSRLGDVLDLELSLEKIGRTSITLTVRFACEGETRAKATSVLVHTKNEVGTTSEWPETLRRALEQQVIQN